MRNPAGSTLVSSGDETILFSEEKKIILQIKKCQVQKSSGILFLGFLVARSAGLDRKDEPGKEKRKPEISKLNVVPFLGIILITR